MSYFTLKNKEFPMTIGVELTCVPIGKYMQTEESVEREIEKVKRAKEQLKFSHDLKMEDGAWEVSSPVCKSHKDIKNFWNDFTKFFKQAGRYVPRTTCCKDNTNYEIGGGGGHIHIGLDFAAASQYYICWMGTQYLPWFFGDVIDNRLLVSAALCDYESLHNKTFDEFASHRLMAEQMFGYMRWGNGPVQIRHKSIRRYDTLEIRAFDSYDNFDELMACVDFVVAFCKMAEHGFVSNIIGKDKTILYALSPEEYHIKDFFNLLEDLNLNPQRYESFIKRYKKRRKEGLLNHYVNHRTGKKIDLTIGERIGL